MNNNVTSFFAFYGVINLAIHISAAILAYRPKKQFIESDSDSEIEISDSEPTDFEYIKKDE